MTQRDPYATTPAEIGTVLAGIAAVFITAVAIADHWPAWATAVIVFVAAPAACLAVYAGVGRINRGGRRRIRLRYQAWPRPALVLTDTPRPACPHCGGSGGWTEPYADHTGEYAGEYDVPCDCWTDWHRTVIRVPRALAEYHDRRAVRRAAAVGYSDEPPF